MAISFVAKSTKKNQSAVSTSTANLPAGYAAGDLLILVASGFISGGTQTFNTPAGWTLLGSKINWGSVNTYLWYKLAASSSETAPAVAFSGGGSGFIETQVYAYTGVNQTTPIDAAASTFNTTFVSPSVTTTSANDKVVHFLCDQNGGSFVVPTGDTSRAADQAVVLSGNFLGDRDQAAAGASPTATWTDLGSSTVHIVTSFAIAPPASATTANAPFISSGTTVYTPTLVENLTVPFIAAATSVYQPSSLVELLAAPFIAAATTLYTPSYTLLNTDAVPFIAAGTNTFTPTLAGSGIGTVLSQSAAIGV